MLLPLMLVLTSGVWGQDHEPGTALHKVFNQLQVWPETRNSHSAVLESLQVLQPQNPFSGPCANFQGNTHSHIHNAVSTLGATSVSTTK